MIRYSTRGTLMIKTRTLLLTTSVLSALAPWCSPAAARDTDGLMLLAQQDSGPDRREQRQEQRQQRQEQRTQQREQRQEQRSQQQQPQPQEQRAQQPQQPQRQEQRSQQQQKPQLQEQRAQPTQQKPQQKQEERTQQRQERQEQRTQQRQEQQRSQQQQQQKPQQEQGQQQRREDARDRRQEQREDARDRREEQRRDEQQREGARDRQEQRREDAQQQRDTRENARRIEDLRKERKETKEGDRTVIREGDRTIIRQDNRTIIRHDEVNRFRVIARDVKVERRGGETRNIIVRPGGIQIINVVDANGRLLRRIRRDAAGREVIIIDNRPRGPGFFLALPPPVVHIPRDRYIVEAVAAPPALLFETLEAPPVMQIDRAYSLDEIRYNPNLRARMRRIDVDTITFDTGSWEVTPDQAARLEPIAHAIQQAIEKNSAEVFLIEGHTDAVGDEVDNLTLSDRRAEAVAIVFSERFGIPPENLVTQGYGEEQLKVQTDGPERQNRRVSIRRITPLLAGNGGSNHKGG
jgi:outer membrane protein OmpA-like peptidoglycan-associated protein